MANDTCPHCGAECGPRDLRYDCGTLHQSSGVDGRSEGCLRTEASQLRNQLATVTAERDDWRDTAAAMMTAACGTDDIDEQERMCNANGTKPSQFVAALKAERDELRRRIDEAPVWWTKPEAVYCDPNNLMVTLQEWSIPGGVAYRLVRDDQP